MSIGLILFLIFMTLKLTHFIDWSWWLIALPIIIEFALYALALILGSFAANTTAGKLKRYGNSVSRR